MKKPALTLDAKDQKWHVTFALDTFTDVDVAIIDPTKSVVVRQMVE